MKEQLMSLYESGEFEVFFEMTIALGIVEEDKAEKVKSFFQKDAYKQPVWSQSLKATVASSQTRRYKVSNLQAEAEKAIIECLAEFKDPLPVMNDFIDKMKPIIKRQFLNRLASGVLGNSINLPNKTIKSRKKILVSALLKNTPGEFKNLIPADTWLTAGIYRRVAWKVAEKYHFTRSWLEYSIRQHSEELFLLVRKLHPKALDKLSPEVLEQLLLAIVRKGLNDNVSDLIFKIRDLVPQLKTEAMRKQFLFAFYDWNQEVNPFEPPESHDKLDFLLRLTTESLKVKMPSTRFEKLLSFKLLMKGLSPEMVVEVFQDAYNIKVKSCIFGREERLRRSLGWSFCKSIKGSHALSTVFAWCLEARRIGKTKELREILSEVFLSDIYPIASGRSVTHNNMKLTVSETGHATDVGGLKVSLIFENVKEKEEEI